VQVDNAGNHSTRVGLYTIAGSLVEAVEATHSGASATVWLPFRFSKLDYAATEYEVRVDAKDNATSTSYYLRSIWMAEESWIFTPENRRPRADRAEPNDSILADEMDALRATVEETWKLKTQVILSDYRQEEEGWSPESVATGGGTVAAEFTLAENVLWPSVGSRRLRAKVYCRKPSDLTRQEIDFDSGSVSFTVPDDLSGGTTTAYGRIVGKTGTTSSGTLYLVNARKFGEFQNNETINGSLGGAASANGTGRPVRSLQTTMTLAIRNATSGGDVISETVDVSNYEPGAPFMVELSVRIPEEAWDKDHPTSSPTTDIFTWKLFFETKVPGGGYVYADWVEPIQLMVFEEPRTIL
jgi:hypothetical protein